MMILLGPNYAMRIGVVNVNVNRQAAYTAALHTLLYYTT